MLTSVRTALSRRSSGPTGAQDISDDELGFPLDVLDALRESFVAATRGDHLGLNAAPLHLVRDARLNGTPPERMVAALKQVWRGTPVPAHADAEAWNALYRARLTRSLALYFGEEGSP
jgi:hypothetical protein